MDLNEYATQFDAIIAATEAIEAVINSVDETAVDEDWRELYAKITSELMIIDPELVGLFGDIAKEPITFEEKTHRFVAGAKTHYEQLKAMAASTSQMFGALGVSGIEFK